VLFRHLPAARRVAGVRQFPGFGAPGGCAGRVLARLSCDRCIWS